MAKSFLLILRCALAFGLIINPGLPGPSHAASNIQSFDPSGNQNSARCDVDALAAMAMPFRPLRQHLHQGPWMSQLFRFSENFLVTQWAQYLPFFFDASHYLPVALAFLPPTESSSETPESPQEILEMKVSDKELSNLSHVIDSDIYLNVLLTKLRKTPLTNPDEFKKMFADPNFPQDEILLFALLSDPKEAGEALRGLSPNIINKLLSLMLPAQAQRFRDSKLDCLTKPEFVPRDTLHVLVSEMKAKAQRAPSVSGETGAESTSHDESPVSREWTLTENKQSLISPNGRSLKIGQMILDPQNGKEMRIQEIWIEGGSPQIKCLERSSAGDNSWKSFSGQDVLQLLKDIGKATLLGIAVAFISHIISRTSFWHFQPFLLAGGLFPFRRAQRFTPRQLNLFTDSFLLHAA